MGLLTTKVGVNMKKVVELERKKEYEELRIQEVLFEVGQTFYNFGEYESHDKDKVIDLCKNIDERKKRIDNLKKEICELNGQALCVKCNTQMDVKFNFCIKCGAEMKKPTSEAVEETI